jgi:hypothetical protein
MRSATKAEALPWFAAYHYTGTVGGTRFFVLEQEGRVLCMCAFGRGGNRFGVAHKFGLQQWGEGWELTRVACHPDAPKNSASACVSRALRVLGDEGHDWVFSYSDTAHGHHGGIYQALGAAYVGTDAKQWVNFELDGLRTSKRAVSGRYGTTRWPEVRDHAAAEGRVLQKVDWCPKHTYVLICSPDRKVRQAITAHLAPRTLPYPKRGAVVVPTPYRNHRPHNETIQQRRLI